MKILLIGNYLLDQQESMQRFANMLQASLVQLNHEVRLIRPKPFFGNIKPSVNGLGKWLGYIDKFLLFPYQLNQVVNWADVVHICDHSNAIYTKYLNLPHLVTCHDLLAITSALGDSKENPTKWTGKQLQRMILTGLKRAQRIVCVSKQTETELLNFGEINSNIVSVIHMGLNYSYAPMQKAEADARLDYLGIPKSAPFLLHVGGNQWYKNRPGVLEIFNHLKQQSGLSELFLVMVGQPFTDRMYQFIAGNSLETQVRELVSVQNEDLRALYSTATALLFPSFQEGFGWPIIEAQACDCPVITSNRTPMTEVGGNAAIYINPDTPEEAAREIVKNLPNISRLKQAGLINVRRFTSGQMLESYIKLYQELCQ